MSTTDDIKKRSMLTALLLILSAVILATGLTHKTSYLSVPNRFDSDRPHRIIYGTMHLTELIPEDQRYAQIRNLDFRGPGFLGVPDDYDNDERIRRFCRKVHEQALRHRQTDGVYDVTSVEFGPGPRGWPLIVYASYHVVDIFEQGSDGKRISDQFWLDDFGKPAFRLAGLICNWLIYFAAMLVVVEIGYRAARALIRRFTRPLPGHCVNCGYNLTGNVSGICSECGHVIRAERA